MLHSSVHNNLNVPCRRLHSAGTTLDEVGSECLSTYLHILNQLEQQLLSMPRYHACSVFDLGGADAILSGQSVASLKGMQDKW